MQRKRTDGIVLHRTEKWTGDDYHALVMKDGVWKFLVPAGDVAFHACIYNHAALAIGIFGDFASMEPGLNWHPTQAQLDETLHLIAKFRGAFPSLKWISGHSALGPSGTAIPNKLVPGHTCPGENFPLDDIIQRSGLITLNEYTSSLTLSV